MGHSVYEEFAVYAGFIAGSVIAVFGCIAVAMSLVFFAESGVMGVAVSVMASFLGVILLGSSLYKMDEWNKEIGAK